MKKSYNNVMYITNYPVLNMGDFKPQRILNYCMSLGYDVLIIKDGVCEPGHSFNCEFKDVKIEWLNSKWATDAMRSSMKAGFPYIVNGELISLFNKVDDFRDGKMDVRGGVEERINAFFFVRDAVEGIFNSFEGLFDELIAVGNPDCEDCKKYFKCSDCATKYPQDLYNDEFTGCWKAMSY